MPKRRAGGPCPQGDLSFAAGWAESESVEGRLGSRQAIQTDRSRISFILCVG